MAWTIVATALLTVLAVVFAMNFATPEKKLGRKVEHRYGVSDPQLQRELGSMLGPGIVPGNQITDLQNGGEIFPALLAAVAAAEKTITFETYIYWSGEVGQQMADALSERASAGVKVKVMIDWVGSIKMDKQLLGQMEAAGVTLHRYRPLRWYNLHRLNNRTHRKLLVVDGRIGFTGGVGIADQWQGNAQDPDHWRDMHFRVTGPVVAQMQAAFNDNWIKTTGEVLNGADYFPALASVATSNAHLFIASPAGGGESMQLMYLMAIAAAEHSIDLEASYFIPDALISQALLAAVERGAQVRIILPGKHIDADTVHFASKGEWGVLLKGGVEIYQYEPTMLHNKLLIIDHEMVSVGSTNFDGRSFRLNDEASLNVYNGDFALHMSAVFDRDLQLTKRFTYEQWRQRSFKDKFAEQVLRPIKSQL